MPIKIYKPTTAGRRHSSVDKFADVTKKTPEKRLTIARKRSGGRNNQGKITIRHRGGGAKQRIREIDFKMDKFDIPATVATIEYDPNRGCRIALLNYKDGEKRYILAAKGVEVGQELMSSRKLIEIKSGNRMPLQFIPVGMNIHNVEMSPKTSGTMVRGAGNYAQLMAMEGEFAQVKLPSGEVRLFHKDCLATIGEVGNADRRLIRWGKAGRTRHRGRRPFVRGKVMNPVDHPHGGGEGRNPIGHPYPKTKWGKHALGVKTRKPKKASWKLIVKRRK